MLDPMAETAAEADPKIETIGFDGGHRAQIGQVAGDLVEGGQEAVVIDVRLVEVGLEEQLDAAVGYIADIQNGVLGDLRAGCSNSTACT